MYHINVDGFIKDIINIYGEDSSTYNIIIEILDKHIHEDKEETAMWERKENDISYWYECSNCGEEAPKSQYGSTMFSNYCPECGRKMIEQD